MARGLLDPARGNPDIWVENLKDGSVVRVTREPGNDILPVWSPNGQQLAYGSGSSLNQRRLSIAAADGTGVVRELPCPAPYPYCEPTDWSPDGYLIVNTRMAMVGERGDIWRVPLAVGGLAEPMLSGLFPVRCANLAGWTVDRLHLGRNRSAGGVRSRRIRSTAATGDVRRRR